MLAMCLTRCRLIDIDCHFTPIFRSFFRYFERGVIQFMLVAFGVLFFFNFTVNYKAVNKEVC